MDFISEIIGYVLVALLPSSIFIALLMAYIQMWQCTEIIQGKCIKITRVSTTYPNYSVNYRTKFFYQYNSKKYEGRSIEDFKKKPENFVEGEAYSLYLHPKKPHMIRCTKKIMSIFEGIVLIFMGLFTLVCVSGLIAKMIEWI